MKPLEVGLIYEPPEHEPGYRVRRKVLALGETSMGSEYVEFLDLIEYRGIGSVSREAFEAWIEGWKIARSGTGGDD